MQDKLLQHSSRFQIVRTETGSAYHSDCYNCIRCHISLLGKPAYCMEDEVGLGAEGMVLCEEILPRWFVQPAEMTGLTKKSEGRQRLRRQKQLKYDDVSWQIKHIVYHFTSNPYKNKSSV